MTIQTQLPQTSMNLDLDLLRTFVAVADLNTFAAAAASVCRTQSAVSQQMQRLEQLVGKELFARHGRNKELSGHGIQLLGYARKILRFNDDACASMLFSDFQDQLTIGVTEDTAGTILTYVMNRITTLYPNLRLDVRMSQSDHIFELLDAKHIDIALTTYVQEHLDQIVIRTSPTLWYCAADFTYQQGDALPLVIQDKGEFYRDLVVEHLNKNHIPWRVSYVANSLSAIKVAVNSGIGATARPAEMFSSQLRVLGHAEGLPVLPDTHYFLSRRRGEDSPFLQSIANVLKPTSAQSIPSFSSLNPDTTEALQSEE